MLRYRSALAILRCFRSSRDGNTAIEFALLAPLYVFLMLGIAAYGIYFGATHSIQQIAADAARTAIAGLDGPERQALASTFVGRNASGYAFVDPSAVVVEAIDSEDDSAQFVVTIRYDARGLPIWNLFPGLPMPSTTIARSSTIRIGGL
ncbi:MAG: TadE/TadG family type IV pilus assembly protein [Rhizobiaceae bacterium]